MVIGPRYEALLAQAHPQRPAVTVQEWENFSIPYTSGTTGKPKGVLLSHRARTMCFGAMAVEFGCYSPDDRALATAPLCHGAGLAFALAPVFFGGTCDILPRFDPGQLLARLEVTAATNVFLVPTHFHAIFGLDAATLDSHRPRALRSIISNAAALPQATKERIVAYFGTDILHECYGATETGIVCNLRPPDQLRKTKCVGLPFPYTEIRILREDGSEAAPGEIGELFSTSPTLFNGYWNRPEETAAALRDGKWVSVGDLATRDDEGYLYIVDRKKDMIISGGINIYPREIEEALFAHPAIADAAVIGIPDAYWGEALKAFVVPRPGARISRRCKSTAGRTSPATRFPMRSTSSTACRATPPARCSRRRFASAKQARSDRSDFSLDGLAPFGLASPIMGGRLGEKFMARAVPAALCAAIMASLLVVPARPADPQKTLLILGDGVPASLDDDGPSGNYPPSQTGFYNLIEPLVQYGIGKQNDDGSETYDFHKFVSALAESWSFDPATNTTTFKLRHGVKSCAGNPFTADDVLYTFARAKSISGQAPIGAFLASVASIANFGPELYPKTPEAIAKRALGNEVAKVDDYTVQIRQTAPNQLLLPVLTIFGLLIYDQKDMKAHATPDDPWSHQYTNTTNAPSFGPWCLDSWRKDEEFTVRANPSYYGGRPYFDRVIYRRVPQSANRIAIIRSGQAGVVEGLNPKEYESLRTARGVKVVGGYLNSTLLMLLNFQSKPLDDPRVPRRSLTRCPTTTSSRTAISARPISGAG